MLDQLSQSLENFSEIYQYPHVIKQILFNPKNVNLNSKSLQSVYWDDLSLMDGWGALIVFFSTLDSISPPEKKFDLIAHRYILEIRDSIEKNGPPNNGSLYDGTAGLCYAIAFASKGRSRYLKLLSSLEEILLLQLSEVYIPQIEEGIKHHKPINFKMYDVIRGFTGMGLYLIQNNLTERSKALIKKLLQLSIQITTPIEYHHYIIPGWFSPAEFLPNKEEQSNNPIGIFNMGLSHGVPSLLGFMSIALRAGFEVSGQKEAMRIIIEWMKSKVTKYEKLRFFKSRVTFEEQIKNQAPISKSLSNREAWCYGTPGVARTLYLAASALGDLETLTYATETFLSIFERSYEEWNLAGPTFCHGTAGTLLITSLMAKDLQSKFLLDKVKELKNILLNFYDENSPFGFRDFDLCKDMSYYPLDKVSLLTGSIGVWLTWLSLEFKQTPQWYYPFMIEYV